MGGFFKSHDVVTRADKISDFQVNTASYGEIVPEVIGTTRVSGNIIYWDDFTAHEHRTTQRVGKGGKSKMTNITYTYTVAVAIGLCEGPITGIGKVWKDKDIYTYPATDIELTLFDGHMGQDPWPYVMGKHPEKALPYSGLAYMAGVVDLGSSGSLPNYNFEVKGKLLETGDGIDVNPADYIAYVLEGVGISAANIDGLDNYRRYCAAADLLISTPPDSNTTKAQAIVNEIADITNVYVFWSHDRLKIVTLADKPIRSWVPANDIKYDLTADDFLPMYDGALVEYRRKESTQTYNQATVEFINRANGYEKETAVFEVVADVQRNGLKPAPLVTAHYLYTKSRAQYLAELLAMKQLYARNEYNFKLDWAFGRLEPGDLVTITDEVTQLDRRVVVITSVREAGDGELEITAVGRPPGIYSPARYDVHETERPFVDYNQAPPSVDDVMIIQPPVDLTLNGNEIWLGVTAPDGWGGCNVWISDTGDKYKYVGSIKRKARMGRLIGQMTKSASVGKVRLSAGELKSGSHLDATRGNTVCWVDGECLSYETANLQADGAYSLSGCVRGQYSTTASSHSNGSRFARLDEAFLRQRYREEDIGKKIYIKCTSLNIFGGQEEDLSAVRAYEYTIQQYYIPDVTDLSLHTRYHELNKGIKAFDVVATFHPPVGFLSFEAAVAWYREQGTSEWKFGGQGDGQIVISGCELGKTYEVRVQTKDVHDHYSQGLTQTLRVELKAEVPNTPEGFNVQFSNAAYFSWREVVNADVDFYELRIDNNPGVEEGKIGKSNTLSFVAPALQNRSGSVFLFAHNPSKGYSAPALLEYNVPFPQAPQVVAKASLGGLTVTVPAIPPSCKGVNVYINNQSYFTPANSLFVGLDSGVYTVRASYVDIFGEGTLSAAQMATVKAEISAEMLADESITADKISASLKKKIESGGAAGSQITQIVRALNAEPGANQYTALVQLSDAIGLRVEKGDVINQINLSPTTTTINGKYLHVTGRTVFDDNIITKGMLQANSVTADKMQVDSLSSISATIGTLRTKTEGGRVEIKDNLIEVYDDNNKLRVRMGVW